MSKIVFLDVDGTLIDYEAKLPASAAKAVDGLLAADLRSIQQPHHSKDGAVLGHFRFDLFSGHSASAFV